MKKEFNYCKKYKTILFQSLPKNKDKWELIVQKATETGVDIIVPLISERSLGKYNPVTDRILKIMTEAAEQSERPVLLKIEEAIKLKNIDQNNSSFFEQKKIVH